MKTLLILVDDEYADTLTRTLPADKAWVLDDRYDAFRCRVRHALETYNQSPESAEIYHDTIAALDRWMQEQM